MASLGLSSTWRDPQQPWECVSRSLGKTDADQIYHGDHYPVFALELATGKANAGLRWQRGSHGRDLPRIRGQARIGTAGWHSHKYTGLRSSMRSRDAYGVHQSLATFASVGD